MNDKMDADTKEVIARLYDTSLSEADILSCISILQMLLEVDGLMPLLHVVKSDYYSMSLRKQAAEAIFAIGNDYVKEEISALLISSSPDLRSLARITLGKAPKVEN